MGLIGLISRCSAFPQSDWTAGGIRSQTHLETSGLPKSSSFSGDRENSDFDEKQAVRRTGKQLGFQRRLSKDSQATSGGVGEWMSKKLSVPVDGIGSRDPAVSKPHVSKKPPALERPVFPPSRPR
ncbi:hypothetical protein SKAU_G00204490 [Synaphobranchus kaupii]|uniref:Uncharacterized protein n=1 Tax=Synaphobranchus kaupii TaxID=118154 RepID=A0A9Q1IYP7_SYNKA|nr:hypothetical protein SKAU_G00204490 [Synaphobranchus kaupii]